MDDEAELLNSNKVAKIFAFLFSCYKTNFSDAQTENIFMIAIHSLSPIS